MGKVWQPLAQVIDRFGLRFRRHCKTGFALRSRTLWKKPWISSGRSAAIYYSWWDRKLDIAQQEIFGPVLCVIPYKDDDDAVRIANDTLYGLAAYISTTDETRASSMAQRLRAGQIRVNQAPFDVTAPFGGFRMSGYGRELGVTGLEEYLEIKACMGFSQQT